MPPDSSAPIRLLLVDDHAIVRQGLRALLGTVADFEIIGEAADGETAVAMAAKLTPDVIIMDVGMPGTGGVEATRRIVADRPAARIIGLTAFSDCKSVTDMLSAGAAGYVVKDAVVSELITAIRIVVCGATYLCKPVLDTMIQLCEQLPVRSEIALSGRETDILRLVADGLSTKQAARHLKLSEKTIETHRRRLMGKLQIDHVAGLTKYAIRQGLTNA